MLGPVKNRTPGQTSFGVTFGDKGSLHISPRKAELGVSEV